MRTYGKLSFEGGRYWLTGVEPHVSMRLKATFRHLPGHSLGPFPFADTAIMAFDLRWFLMRYPMEAEPAVLERLAAGERDFHAEQAEVGRILANDYQPPAFAGLQPGQEVRQHQAQNASLLQRFGGLLVADAIGEGKTYTGGAACLLPGALPVTIVGPPHLRDQWREKLEAFTTLSVHVVKGTKPYQLPPVDVRIFGYTQLAGWIDVLDLLGTGLAIFEEGHALRNGVGTPSQPVKKGIAALKLSESARLKLMLTGTPVFNYGADIWRLMEMVRPEVLGSWRDFQTEWCMGEKVRDPAALRTFLIEQHAMTRKAGQGPKPNVIIQDIDYDAARLEALEDFAHEMAVRATRGSWEQRGQAMRELDMRLRQETGIAKAPFVAKYVRMVVEAGEKVLLFGWHRAVYDIWLEELSDLGVCLYTGTESPAQKAQAKALFMAGEAQVMIMSLRSGEGVDDLQHHASTAIIGELDWTQVVHDQCIGRLNREGQPRWQVEGGKVDAIYLVAADGADPPMLDTIGIKAGQAAGILGDKAERDPDDMKLKRRLVDRYLKASPARAGGGVA